MDARAEEMFGLLPTLIERVLDSTRVDYGVLPCGWLIAKPSASAKELMNRLATMFPEAYAGNAQLRTLQRRVQAWRAAREKEMILGRLHEPSGIPAKV